MKKSFIKPILAPGVACAKSAELPKVMSLESVSVGSEDYKFEIKIISGCGG